MISIYGFPAHTTKERTSGVDFARIIQPVNHLGKVEGFEIELFNPLETKSSLWSEVTQKFDVIYFNYLTMDWGYAPMGMMARKNHCKLVMDIDDNLWNIKEDNSAYSVLKRGSPGLFTITQIINDVDYVTCTNNYLKNAVCNNSYKRQEFVKVFPNYIDLDLYKTRLPFKDTHFITIAHFGSTSHFKSLGSDEFRNAMDRLMHEYPNIKFKTIGSFFGTYKQQWGQRYEYQFGDMDLYKWIEKMPSILEDIDIIVAPLDVDIYNRAKSSIKYLETSSFKKPFVGTRIRQYEEIIQNGVNGFLCSTENDWYNNLKKLIDDKELRRKMGEEGFKTVEKDWTINGNIKDYSTFFKEVINS
jgi:glycosyltransferase involved in cell wall biosynthesis